MDGEFASRCPRCNSATVIVADSREYDGQRRRRRHCKTCKHRWSTVEVPADMAERYDTALQWVDKAIDQMTKLRHHLAAHAIDHQGDIFGDHASGRDD